MRNDGRIAGLPDDVITEGPVRIARPGQVEALPAPALPALPAAILAAHAAFEALAVAATEPEATRADRVRAMLANPMVSTYDMAARPGERHRAAGRRRRAMTDPLVVAVDVGATKTLLTVRTADGARRRLAGIGPVGPRREPCRPGRLRGLGRPKPWSACARRRGGHVAAVGVAAPGPLDAASGVVTRSSNLGWHDVPLASMLSERLGAPVALEDDANTAASGSGASAPGQGADPLGYLTVSSGIGGGLVVGGDIVRGATGNAGEVGHLVIDPEGPRCACGRRGDVESFAGGAAMARRARTTWPRRETAEGRPRQGPPPRTSSAAARRGDAQALGLVGDATEALATAFAALAAVVEPQVIVVGGSIGLGQRRHDAQSRDAGPPARAPRERAAPCVSCPAALGQESVLAGAADLGLRLDRVGLARPAPTRAGVTSRAR